MKTVKPKRDPEEPIDWLAFRNWGSALLFIAVVEILRIFGEHWYFSHR